MAELHVQRKPRSSRWLWLIIVILILAVLLYYLYTTQYQNDNSLTGLVNASKSFAFSTTQIYYKLI